MTKLLSRSKHEEFESNSAFHIRNQEERIAENRGNWFLRALQQIDNLPTENSIGNIKNSVGN